MDPLIVSIHVSIDDIIFIEPTLEALYYKFSPRPMIVRVPDEAIPFFEHHPLIHRTTSVLTEMPCSDEAVELVIANLGTWCENLSVVQRFAACVGAKLMRHTPKIFLDAYPSDTDTVVITDANISVPGVFLPKPTCAETIRKALTTLAGATLVVGPDNWMTQAAAALDTRVVISMDLEKESLRAPFNTVVAAPADACVAAAAVEALYEKRYPSYMNQGNAAEWIKEKAKRYVTGNFVDVGCSSWPIPNGIAVDVHNRETIEDAEEGQFAGVFSSHCLEHIEEWKSELELWHKIIRTGGILFMYLPHPRAEVWHAHTGSWVGSNHVWNPEPVTLVRHLREVLGMHIVEYNSRHDAAWSYTIIARKA